MKNIKGFTLVELLVAMGVTMVLMGAVYMAVNATQRNSSAIERKVAAQQDIKPVLDLMAMEIGMASYNPTAAANLWVNPTGACTANSPNPGYRGIQEATTNSIVVEMDISGSATGDGDGSLGPPDNNEVIRYSYNTVYQYITRETNCGGGQPFLGDIPTRTRAVRVINNTAGTGNAPIPVFRYYDGTGADIGATLPAAIPDIRRIDITLAVETENVDPNTGLRRQLIYSTSVIPRNHAIQ
ncbi:MAG: prepilin-type N-terminal cleavage/methylation domain-containing protein [Deltaproteobacteria bacterium]